jgi:hypothetical protein
MKTLVVAQFVLVVALSVGWLCAKPSDKQATPASSATAGFVNVRDFGAKGDGKNDDTAAIQAAIDSLDKRGGVAFFPAGTYRFTGLKGRPNLHLQGAHTPSTVLDYTRVDGDGITFDEDPDYLAISALTITSSSRSTGWGVRADRGVHRYFRFERLSVTGFLNCIFIGNALNCTIEKCQIGHTYPNDPKGIGIQLGDGRAMGGNGVTIEDCYFSSLEKGVVTYAQACVIQRPIIELCRVGIETHGISTVIMPWADSTTKVAHVDIQPNTVGGRRSGTGALLLGYGSSGWRVRYGSDTERRRTIILPDRLDFGPGDDPNEPHGIKLGRVVITDEGVVHLKDIKSLSQK